MRLVSGILLAFALAGSLAAGVAAQNEVVCDDVSADKAQTILDQNPTYATRAVLDADGDGIACEADEGGAGGIGGGGRITSGQADDAGNQTADEPGVRASGRSAGGQGSNGSGTDPAAVADQLPVVGVGSVPSTVSIPLLLAALGFAVLGGTVAGLTWRTS